MSLLSTEQVAFRRAALVRSPMAFTITHPSLFTEGKNAFDRLGVCVLNPYSDYKEMRPSSPEWVERVGKFNSWEAGFLEGRAIAFCSTPSRRA